MNYYAIGGGRYIIAHHGVQGMRWGVRRYQPYGSGYAPIGNPKTGFRRRMGIRAKALIDSVTVIPKDFKEAKTWHRKVSSVFGHQHAKSVSAIHAKAQEDLANASKTSLGKIYHDTKRVNYQHDVGYQNKILDMNLAERAFEAVIPVQYFTTPVSRLSGRTTSRGRRAIDKAIGGFVGMPIGPAGIALDAGYIARNSNARKINYNDRGNVSEIRRRISDV